LSSKRAGYAVLAWGAATATAMAVVGAGLDSVLPATVDGPHVATVAAWPVQVAGSLSSPLSGSGSSSPAATKSTQPVTTHPASPTPARTTAPSTATPTESATTSSPPSVTGKRYTTVGGTAVITLYSDHAVLDAAIPNTGFSARSWTNTDTLEVEFSPPGTGAVYEVIATWNGTSPQVNTYTVGG
jgi:hypothetical protein